MLISTIQNVAKDGDIIDIICEREFDRFARTTSKTCKRVCVFVGSRRFVSTIPDNATMVITTEDIAKELKGNDFGICVSINPKSSYFRLFAAAASFIEKNDKQTSLGTNCSIGRFANISEHNVIIGNNVTIEDFVTIYDNVIIGDNCVIRAGARIGVQDYNYYLDNGHLVHLPHYGNLIIEDDVEIGFNSVVGKSLYPDDSTIIGAGSKLANCCAVGHDCSLGKRVMIYAGSMIAGYVTIGDDTHVTLNSTIKNGVTIGRNVQIDMGSVVIRSIPDNTTVFGNPAKKLIAPK